MITTLSQLIALVESGNQPHAVRFEPKWRYTTDEVVQRCIRAHAPAYMNFTTAMTICAMSVGAYQIMLSVLYEMGYKGSMAKFMSDESLQLEWFNLYIQRRAIDFRLGDVLTNEAIRMKFAIKYNGDGPGYSAKILKVARDNGVI